MEELEHMANIRLQRLSNRGERIVIVAMDHCLFDGPTEGMINLSETARKVAPCVDGILLSPAMLPHCQDAFNYKGAPMAVARLNWSTTYCFTWNYRQGATVPAFSPAEALRLGADIALVSLTLETGSEANDAHNIAVFRQVCREAKKLGMPVIGEYFPVEAERLDPDELHAKVYMGTRIVAELGADLIKTFYTHTFRAVTDSSPVPVLGLGAAKLPTQRAALQLAADEVAAGAGGVVFGRNALQVPNPRAFQQALCDVVKHGTTPDDAVRKYALE
jgi:fructose-bisphosphate aldolase/2-amino-3,7-dideoxy-D-threo-hept-6-ulosonate synthase